MRDFMRETKKAQAQDPEVQHPATGSKKRENEKKKMPTIRPALPAAVSGPRLCVCGFHPLQTGRLRKTVSAPELANLLPRGPPRQ